MNPDIVNTVYFSLCVFLQCLHQKLKESSDSLSSVSFVILNLRCVTPPASANPCATSPPSARIPTRSASAPGMCHTSMFYIYVFVYRLNLQI